MQRTKPQPTTVFTPCDICGNTSGDCRQIEIGWLCQKLTDGIGMADGYEYRRLSKNGVWGVWVESTVEMTESERSQWQQKKNAISDRRRANEKQHRETSLTAESRHRYYQKLLSCLSLDAEDLADLTSRGLTADQAKTNGYRSISDRHRLDIRLPSTLPGIASDEQTLLNSQAGYLCPCRTANGLIAGLQYRRRESGAGGRYRWLSSDTAAVNMPDGQLPLSVFRAKSDRIAFCEGTGPKPHITSLRLGANVVGASGGSWASSPRQLRKALVSIRAKECVLYPDAGANMQVFSRYQDLQSLLKPWGYLLKVCWWGQSSKDHSDVDESVDLSEAMILEWSEYKTLMEAIAS